MECFTHGQVLDELGVEIFNYIKNYTTSLYYYHDDGVVHCGSGTFILFKGFYYVVTAAHVIENIWDHEFFGFLVRDKKNIIKLQTKYYESFMLKAYDYTVSGPDLGVIKLNPIDVSKVSAAKSFLDIEKQQDIKSNMVFKKENSLWCTTGFPVEKVKRLKEGTRVFGQLTLLDLEGDYILSGYHFLKFNMKGSKCSDGLKSYEGMSGGSVWQIIIGGSSDNLVVVLNIFSGVIFYQLDEDLEHRPLVSQKTHDLIKFLDSVQS